MLDLYGKIEEAVAVISERWGERPRAGIILGTGLGPFVEQIEIAAEIDYEAIPHFPSSTATSHRGRLICGTLEGVPVVAMEGRVHLYEGHAAKLITLPVRVMRALGAEWLIASNAVGGMNPNYQAGDIMVIEDHINLMTDNPLIGVNDDRLGPRFPDMSEPYNLKMVNAALAIARKCDFVAHKGVLVAVTGPNLENTGRIPLSPFDWCGCCRHVGRTGSHYCGPLWAQGGRFFCRHRYVPSRCPSRGSRGRDHRHRQCCRTEAAGIGRWCCGADRRRIGRDR